MLADLRPDAQSELRLRVALARQGGGIGCYITQQRALVAALIMHCLAANVVITPTWWPHELPGAYSLGGFMDAAGTGAVWRMSWDPSWSPGTARGVWDWRLLDSRSRNARENRRPPVPSP